MNLTIKQIAEQWFAFDNNMISYHIYGKYGQHVIDHHEQIRQKFRLYCNLKLGIDYNINNLIEFYKKIANKEIIPESAFIDITELEFLLSELFQIEVLNIDQNIINQNRLRWSFKNYLRYNDGYYDKNYKGTLIKYNEWYN